jgi:hypothetical protein
LTRCSSEKVLVEEAWARRLLDALSTKEARGKLHEIELMILDGLHKRPLQTWCLTHARMLAGLYAKAYEVPLTPPELKSR